MEGEQKTDFFITAPEFNTVKVRGSKPIEFRFGFEVHSTTRGSFLVSAMDSEANIYTYLSSPTIDNIFLGLFILLEGFRCLYHHHEEHSFTILVLVSLFVVVSHLYHYFVS